MPPDDSPPQASTPPPPGQAAPTLECLEALDDLPLGQGDVIAFLAPRGGPPHGHGVIVTADCDIAQSKHRGTLSYVPVLRLATYLALFVMPRKLASASRPVDDPLSARLRAAQKANRPDFPGELGDPAILAWVRRSPADEILSELRIGDAREAAQIKELCALHVRAATARDSESLGDQAETLVALRGFAGKASTMETVEQELRGDLRSLPGDAFFLSALTPSEREGYVVYLRFVRELPESAVAIRQPDLTREEVVSKRIARLSSPYVYGLTQRLGSVFSSIGLPVAYEKRRDSHALPFRSATVVDARTQGAKR